MMIGISLVGYSGSLIKDAVKEDAGLIGLLRSSTHFLDELPPPEPSKEPEVTKVLVGPYSTIRSLITATLAFTDLSPRGPGVFFILFAQVLYVISVYTHLPLLISLLRGRPFTARRPSSSSRVRTLPNVAVAVPGSPNEGAD